MANRWGNNVRLFIGGSKITADGDCSHEIKRCLLLGRKAMTNLDSILKSRDFTLSLKDHLVKAMVFPVVMYRCECWTIKKAERRGIDAFNCGAGEDSRVPWTARKSNQSIFKKINPEDSLEGLMLTNTFVTWWEELTRGKNPHTGEDWGQEKRGGNWGWDGWMSSLTQWTCVLVNFGR